MGFIPKWPFSILVHNLMSRTITKHRITHTVHGVNIVDNSAPCGYLFDLFGFQVKKENKKSPWPC